MMEQPVRAVAAARCRCLFGRPLLITRQCRVSRRHLSAAARKLAVDALMKNRRALHRGGRIDASEKRCGLLFLFSRTEASRRKKGSAR